MEFIKVISRKIKLRQELLVKVGTFHITRKPINYKLFNEFLKDIGKKEKNPRDSFLIKDKISYEQADHQQAKQFCTWFSEKTGLEDLQYQLPNESQLFSAYKQRALVYNDKDNFFHRTNEYSELVDDYYHPDIKEYKREHGVITKSDKEIQNENIDQVIDKIIQKDDENLDNVVFKPLARAYSLNEKHNIPQLLQKAQYLERYLPKNATYQGLLKKVKGLLADIEQDLYEYKEITHENLELLIKLLTLISRKCRTQLQKKSYTYKLDKDNKNIIINQLNQAIEKDKKYTDVINKQFSDLQDIFMQEWPKNDKKALIPTKNTLDTIRNQTITKNYSNTTTHHRTIPNKHFPGDRTMIIFKPNFIRVQSVPEEDFQPSSFFRLVISKNQYK